MTGASTDAAKLSSIRLTSRRKWRRCFCDNDISKHERSFGERVRQMVDAVDSQGSSSRTRNLRKGEAQDENKSRCGGDNPATYTVLHIVMDTDAPNLCETLFRVYRRQRSRGSIALL